MSHTSDRRGFVGSVIACLAAAPVATADAEKPSPSSIAEAVASCRQAAEGERMGEQAAYGKALVARFGPAVVETIRETTTQRARQWMLTASIQKRDLETVKTRLWNGLGPRFEWRCVEQTPTRLRFEVSKCPFAEGMRRLDAAELGFAHYCAFDIGFCQGLNPALRFTRTKTLMMGDSVCDHAYELPEQPPPKA